ncbi:MAG: c-type cytochrome [Nitrospinales bacterium]
MRGRESLGFRLAVVVTVLWGVAACTEEPPLVPPKYIAGHKVFFGYCSGCHGKAGGPKPTLLEKRYLPTRFSDARMMEVVRNGKGRMPAQGGMLRDKDIKEAVRFVRYLQKKHKLGKKKN